MTQPALRYIERDGRPVPEPDMVTWQEWQKTTELQLAHSTLDRGLTVETRFLPEAHTRDDGRLYHYVSVVQTQALGWGTERIHYQQRDLALQGHDAIVRDLWEVLNKLAARDRGASPSAREGEG